MTKGERAAAKHPIGKCSRCGKNSFTSRKAAVQYGRKIHGRSGHLNAYPCPANPKEFHYGNLPKMVTQGQAGRATLKVRHV